MKLPLLVSVALIVIGCTSQKKMNLVRTDLLTRICDIEEKRHGKSVGNGDFRHFGNIEIDRFLANPGRPELLYERLLKVEGVCRRVMLYLLNHAHSDFIATNLPQIDAHLNDLDRIALMNDLHAKKDIAYADVFLYYLGPAFSPEVRSHAAINTDLVPPDRRAHAFAPYLNPQADAELLRGLIINLDLTQPSAVVALNELAAHPSNDVHETILIAWATSESAEKKQYLEAYRDHPTLAIRESARGYLAQLTGKDKLAWKARLVPPPGALKKKAQTLPQVELLAAIYENKPEIVQRYLDRDVDPGKPDPLGRIPLLEAALFAEENILRMLISGGGADMLTAVDAKGNNALMAYAGRYTSTDQPARYKDEVVNLPERRGAYPLNPPIEPARRIPLLLALGFDIDARNRHGENRPHRGRLERSCRDRGDSNETWRRCHPAR